MIRTFLSTTAAAALSIAPAQAQSIASKDDAREATFKSGISAARMDGYIRTLTEHPTTPGSPWSLEIAQKTLAMFREWGWDARIEEFSVLFPTPLERKVELLGDKPFTAKLDEPAIPGDPYSARKNEIIPPFFMYGPDGDVTAPLVFVNFGLRDDYDELARLGVDVRGKIAIVRAGGMWRGGKVQLAAEHGAKAMLIYSDPKEDGYYREEPYPAGPGRNQDGVQRGSVLYGKYPGDPSTPYGPSVPGAKRVAAGSPESSVAAIPAMPLSFGDAMPLLASLGGQIVPESWRGALPISYRTGPSAAMVHMVMRYDWKNVTIYDVSARLKGSVYPNELVVRGNHRDGWVYGAQDPHSGHSTLLEEARVLGGLYRGGWRPKRTLVYNSWDAEEQGVIGSTEWAEKHARELDAGAVAYLNTDMAGSGIFTVSGTSSLAEFVTRVADGIVDPNTGVPITRRAAVKSEHDIYQAPTTAGMASGIRSARTYDAATNLIRPAPPGYSSDHQVFVSHVGIPTLNMQFGGEDSVGSYHTGYDDYTWYSKFNDPGLKYAAATAQVNGIAVMRLADADLLPLEFGSLATAIDTEIQGLKQLDTRLRNISKQSNATVEADAYKLLQFRNMPRVAPPITTIPPLDFTSIDRAGQAIRDAATRYATAKAAADPAMGKQKIVAVNTLLRDVERAYLRKGGLPGRPHYRNELFSPGRLWDTVPFPAIGDAMLDKQWPQAAAQIPLAAETLTNIAQAIDAAAIALAKR